ncbi:helix-turn-helix domain-containing protein [Prochlorococcus marinus]|uniref:helix-turn-helix domain-containing protein n=1 Tax=Prochlorococcus marinus TaxID=1219 RepID=UPI0039B0C3D4
MIRSYLRLIEIIEMISRRLTKIQKAEILEAYKAGYNSNSLAEKYNCTTSTILRIVKTLLSDVEYKLLKEERSKSSNKKGKSFDYQNLKEQDLRIESYEDSEDLEIEQISTLSLDNNNDFELIAPLLSQFGVEEVKPKSDYEILDYSSLPESVYMIVDKKVELDSQLISDLPEWSFLPENELKRNAILLFSNQRAAKRSCLKNQRVIKIPNTDIFKLSKSYLISKGITRLILEDTIMALD